MVPEIRWSYYSAYPTESNQYLDAEDVGGIKDIYIRKMVREIINLTSHIMKRAHEESPY